MSDSPSSLSYNLSRLLTTRLRIDSRLDSLVLLLSSQQLRPDRPALFATLAQIDDPLRALKVAILVQRCLVQGNMSEAAEVVQRLRVWACTQRGFLSDAVLLPYLSYLQKRVLDESYLRSEEGAGGCSSAKSVSTKLTIDSENETSLFSEFSEDWVAEAYYLINLIGKMTGMGRALVTMIRYFGPKEGFVLDFNITLAMDLRVLFQRLYLKLKPICSFLKRLKSEHDPNRCLSQAELGKLQQLQELFTEVERINQQSFLIFFNCYYYRSTKRLCPTQPNPQKYLNIISEAIASNQKSKPATVDSDFMERSVLFVKKVVSLGLIKNESTVSLGSGRATVQRSEEFFMEPEEPEQPAQTNAREGGDCQWLSLKLVEDPCKEQVQAESQLLEQSSPSCSAPYETSLKLVGSNQSLGEDLDLLLELSKVIDIISKNQLQAAI